jgi:hypothetical protein
LGFRGYWLDGFFPWIASDWFGVRRGALGLRRNPQSFVPSPQSPGASAGGWGIESGVAHGLPPQSKTQARCGRAWLSYLPNMPVHFSCTGHFTRPLGKVSVPHYRYFFTISQGKAGKANFRKKVAAPLAKILAGWREEDFLPKGLK